MTFDQRLRQLADEGNLRSIPVEDADARVVDLSTNDYLGLARRDDLRRTFLLEAAEHPAWMAGSSASRLLASAQSEYHALERLLEQLYGRPALLFNSGWHANTGIISALAAAGDTLIIADRLMHASAIDGMRLSGAPFERFRHNDVAHLERLVARARQQHILVLTESVFSMDGDRAPLDDLFALRRRDPRVMLYVDEAHAVGVLGPRGLGLTASHPDGALADIVVGTFGKALASMGAYAIVSDTLRRYLVNTCRPLIFSTALPPLQAAWSRRMLLTALEMEAERRRLQHLAQLLDADSHIIPRIVGTPQRAVALSQQLLREGYRVLPIRTPTVPPGTDRLRISLSAHLDAETVTRFANTLRHALQ